ncbi:TIGR02265 family protein [Archangium sp.]|jgi:uncharacterized protein (TIGR02265 family)|uniref:TIGR02265 family protein n=1 Tax=Archangium sp. TaxID=1872627 RepID=UPI002ED9B707
MDTPATSQPLVPGSEEELRCRLSLVSPTDHLRGIFFTGVLELVRREEGEAAAQCCLQVCEETQFLDFFDYSYEVFLRLLYTAGRVLSDRHGGFEKALWWMGYEVTKVFYASSAAGRVLLLMAQGDPRRLLSNVPSSLQLVSRNRECQVRLQGPKSGVMLKHDLLPRAFIEGGLVATFDAAKVKGVQVRSRPLGPTENEYEFTWA